MKMKIKELNELPPQYVTADGLSYFYKKLMEKLSKCPTFEHKCHNCGGTVVLDVEKHIFNCPYCDSVYAVGTAMINDKEN